MLDLYDALRCFQLSTHRRGAVYTASGRKERAMDDWVAVRPKVPMGYALYSLPAQCSDMVLQPDFPQSLRLQGILLGRLADPTTGVAGKVPCITRNCFNNTPRPDVSVGLSQGF